MFKRQPKAQKITSLAEIDSLAKTGRPVLVDFYQDGCAPCQVMDGIMNELSREYGATAHVVKANVGNMPDAVAKYKIRSTPTMVLLSTPPPKRSKKARQKKSGTAGGGRQVMQRWRASGLVQKDYLSKLLESNGATRASTG